MVEKLKKELGHDKDGPQSENNECVKVAIRARPLSKKETEAGHVQVV